MDNNRIRSDTIGRFSFPLAFAVRSAANLHRARAVVVHIVDVDRFEPRIAPKHLRRLPESAQERPTHLIAVAETGLASHLIDRVTALLHEVASALDPKVLDRLGR
jgi:hypothetical protein